MFLRSDIFDDVGIFTSDDPENTGLAPDKKPYLVIKLSKNSLYLNAQREEMQRAGLFSLGLSNETEDARVFTITSARKVIRAIEILNRLPSYQNINNTKAFRALAEYKKNCEEKFKEKGKKIPPTKSKSLSLFERNRKEEIKLPTSFNVTQVVKEKSSKSKQSNYVHKPNVKDRKISEIEAFNGFCYRLLLGDRHPKMIITHDKNGAISGVGSEMIQNYITVYKYTELRGKLSSAELLNRRFIDVLVAAYTEEETDLHARNYGFNSKGFFVKIDDDRSTWPLTSKYADISPNKESTIGNNYKVHPASDFNVTKNDIRHFPFITDANPYHWFDRNYNEQYFEANAVRELMNNQLAIDAKHYMFLKRILIPNQTYESIGKATIGTYEKSDKTRRKFINHKCKKTDALKNELLDSPEFQNYIINNPTVIEKIKAEFNEYNKEFDNAQDAYLKVDLNEVENNFKEIRRELIHKTEANRLGLIYPEKIKQREKMEELSLNILKRVTTLYNAVVKSNVDQFSKEEVNKLEEWLNTLLFNKEHISAYKLSLMINSVIVSRDNIKRLHHKGFVYNAMDVIANDSLKNSGLSKEKVASIKTNYNNNIKSTRNLDTEKLNKLSDLVTNELYWNKRGNPWQISEMYKIMQEESTPFVQWENIIRCANHAAGMFERAPHKDMQILRKAILDNDYEMIASITEVAENETERELLEKMERENSKNNKWNG